MSEAEATAPPRKARGGIVGALLVLLVKAKSIFPLGFKLLKYVKTVVSMGVMVWAYSQRLGWVYAAGFVLLILVHELGHGFAGKLLGYEMSTPVFIPFIGAFISLKNKPRNDFQNFVIGAGGPLAGTLGALACLGAASVLEAGTYAAELLSALGYSALVLNLFNLMPIGFLDGGRMSTPITRRGWVVGYLLLVAWTIFLLHDSYREPNGVAVLVLLVGLIQLFLKIAKKKAPENGSLTAGGVYFGLAGALIFLVHWFAP